MRRECIEELINGNREIEFKYHGRWYSITYYNDNREKYISVCEFYNKPTDVRNVEELFNLYIGNHSLKEIFEALPDSAFNIY